MLTEHPYFLSSLVKYFLRRTEDFVLIFVFVYSGELYVKDTTMSEKTELIQKTQNENLLKITEDERNVNETSLGDTRIKLDLDEDAVSIYLQGEPSDCVLLCF